MAKKKASKKEQERYYFIGALVVVAVGMVVFAYLVGVQHTLNALQAVCLFNQRQGIYCEP